MSVSTEISLSAYTKEDEMSALCFLNLFILSACTSLPDIHYFLDRHACALNVNDRSSNGLTQIKE